MAAGANPKVIKSASESSSLPIGEATLSNRAEKPSKKSKTAPQKISATASSSDLNWVVEITTENTPHSKLQIVSVLGMCFFISNRIKTRASYLFFNENVEYIYKNCNFMPFREEKL